MDRDHQSRCWPAGCLSIPVWWAVAAILLVTPAGSGFGAETPAAKDSSTTDARPPTAKAAVPASGTNAESQRDQTQKKLAASTKPADTDRSPRRNTDLDRQLLRDLLPDLPIPSDLPKADSKQDIQDKAKPRSRIPLADELDEAVEAMREVSRRLGTRNLSDETANLQTDIVSNIDALIEKLQNLPPPSASESSDPSDQDQSEQDPQQDQDQEPGSKQRSDKTSQTQPGADSASRAAPQPETGKSRESTEENTRQARERAAALARRRALIDEVWGHLPPVMRERLLNVGGEKLLPKYEDMIRRYYESLAEPDRARSRRPAKAGF